MKDDHIIKTTFTRKEIYIALQAVAEARDNMPENDIQAIMNATSAELESMADKLLGILKSNPKTDE